MFLRDIQGSRNPSLIEYPINLLLTFHTKIIEISPNTHSKIFLSIIIIKTPNPSNYEQQYNRLSHKSQQKNSKERNNWKKNYFAKKIIILWKVKHRVLERSLHTKPTKKRVVIMTRDVSNKLVSGGNLAS